MARKAGDLGLFGAWLNSRYPDRQRIEFAAELEDLGFRTIWLGGGREPVGELRLHEAALRATREATIVPAIINMWKEPAEIVAEGYRRVRSEFGDRFLLGIGADQPEGNARSERPYAKLADYLDRLDDSGVPAGDRILAALSPKTLSLAGARSAGAHPYLTTPAHTRAAREILGPGPLLAPEHKVVVSADPVHARSIGRPMVRDPYLSLRNYTNNMLREGFTPGDIADGGSDKLIDSLVLHGTPGQVLDGLRTHHAAGADHVAIQVVASPGETPMAGFRALAGQLQAAAAG
jgi:probable F420-dependent oxidoreductase